MSIPSHIIDQLNSQADLVSIIGRHTQLKKAGNEFKGCCPFHGEKTPSFYVHPIKNVYHCFGCGVSGNAIGFLKDYENLTFIEAVHELSKQTGIDIPKDNGQNTRYRRNKPANQIPAQTPSLSQQAINTPYHDIPTNDVANIADVANVVNPSTDHMDQLDGDLYELLQRVHQFYQNNLKRTRIAQNYFKNRGLTDESIATFGLGYAPNDWQGLSKAFPQDIEGLITLGLIRSSDKGRLYDLMRNRVIFAIRDNQGRVIAFAGRALDDADTPKYINSSDSPIFHKNQILYGYYESRQQKAQNWLVVEGYMDVIALYQAGIYGAVASMGTAINEQQIQRLLKFNNTLTLSFDGDSAGQKAAWRTLKVGLSVLQDNQTLKFLTLPENHDPDSYVKAFGKDAMLEQIDHATILSDYIFAYLSMKIDLTKPEGKANMMAEVKQLTALLPKGSSFRYLLNNDIYYRLRGGRNRTKVTKDALINFNNQLQIHHHLQLCLFYQPELIDIASLERIWQLSGIHQYRQTSDEVQTLNQRHLPVPPLPTWAYFDNQKDHNALLNLIETIQLRLSQSDVQILFTSPNHAFHYLLASLPYSLYTDIIPHWQDFHHRLNQRGVNDLSLYFQELACRRLNRIFEQQIQGHTNIHAVALINKQRYKLNAWLADLQKNYN